MASVLYFQKLFYQDYSNNYYDWRKINKKSGICFVKRGIQTSEGYINKAKSLPVVANVKTMYGIYDIMIILESNDMGAIKKTIDGDLHELDGITNMTSLVTVGIAGAILE